MWKTFQIGGSRPSDPAGFALVFRVGVYSLGGVELIYQCIHDFAAQTPEAIAIMGVDGERFTFAELNAALEKVAVGLKERGVTKEDRLAMVFPEGPGAALAFLALSMAGVCAPLNPGYQKRDFEFYLDDLLPKAVVLPEGLDLPVIAVAEARGIPVWRLRIPSASQPNTVELLGNDAPSGSTSLDTPNAGAVAMILHTSGTTSRPKMVPLTHGNLAASAENIVRVLELKAGDRALNVMPLFHIHGIVGCLLSTMSSGGSMVCAPGFRHTDFMRWAADYEPTWYSAVPTIHQAVLEQAKLRPNLAAALTLRLIRSSSAALPPAVFHELEEIWKVPVIESYGMTEASHQMASNLLPPGQRKPGSVGVPAGPDIAILDQAGKVLPEGATGEVSIRGAAVTSGYLNNTEANSEAFTNGWFRTGDEGRFDEDGYLFLTGRLKEMINRGGENIAPKEIDEALLEHPAVSQAVAFSVPHPTLGEDLAAAVVLGEDLESSESELRDYLVEALADFKVPTRIIFVDSIPKGPTGKLQRIGLFERLKANLETDFEELQSEEERTVAAAFAEVLGVGRVGRRDNFFFLGGDSLKGQRVLAQIREALQIEISPVMLFRFPDPAGLGAEIKRLSQTEMELEALAEELKDLSPEELEQLLKEGE